MLDRATPRGSSPELTLEFEQVELPAAAAGEGHPDRGKGRQLDRKDGEPAAGDLGEGPPHRSGPRSRDRAGAQGSARARGRPAARGQPEQTAAELLKAARVSPSEVRDRPPIRQIATDLQTSHPRTAGVRELAALIGPAR